MQLDVIRNNSTFTTRHKSLVVAFMSYVTYHVISDVRYQLGLVHLLLFTTAMNFRQVFTETVK